MSSSLAVNLKLTKLAGFSGVALLAAALFATSVRAEEWNKTYQVSGRPHVRVDTNDASVRVTTTDSNQVEFHVLYNGYSVNKNLTINSSQSGDQVEVSARVSRSWGLFSMGMNRNLRIEVRMPRNGDLNVDTGDGSVESDAVTGNVDIHTGDGHIRIDGAKGDIRLRTGDGHIDGRDLDGKLEATSGDGHVTIEGRFDSLNIKTGDGRIDARVNRGSKLAYSWTIHTGDGSVDLSLPDDLQANIDASTSDGRISLGIPVTVEGTFKNSEIHGKMNGGGQPLTIHTGDGSIHLSKT